MEWIGTLRYLDLGTGQWVLETEQGDRYPLVGAVPTGLKDEAVAVSGQQVDALGFGTTAERPIEVREIRARTA